MNLVQIQERLKDAPVQAIMQYANGTNPMVPPYLALAELKRRETMTQSAQAQQAMQQGQQPSVKEQVEQAAGLAGLQRQMQAQGMQNLMAQVRPQGVPENTPQPSRQPESEGVAALPTGDMYNFRDGGIVAFAAGGNEGMERLLSPEELKDAYYKARDAGDLQGASRIFRALKQREAAAPRTVTVPVAAMDDVAPRVETPRVVEQPVAAKPAVARSTPEQYATAQSEFVGDPQEVLRGIMSIPDPTERAAALDSLKRPKTGAPTPAAPSAPVSQGIMAIPGAQEAQDLYLEAMRKKSTPEGIVEQQRKLEALYGLDKQYGEERAKRIQAMEAERQKSLEERGLERLMRVMGGMAGRGLAGAGPAYLQSVETERAADAAFRKQMDEMLGGVEKEQRAEQVTRMKRAQEQMAEERKSAMEGAGKIMDIDSKIKLQELQAKSVLGRLSAEEEYTRRELAKGRSLPDIMSELSIAKAGGRAEMTREGKLQAAQSKYLEMSKDLLGQNELKKQGIKTLDDFLRKFYPQLVDESVSAGIPPIPAGAVRLKGAQ
jgi:hypothetical protein